MSTNTAAITPFWQRLREIMLYPSKPAALMTVVGLGVLRLFALFPGLPGLIFGLLIWVGIYKYAFEVLRNTANGKLEPPEGSLNVDESMGWGAVRLQAMFVVFYVLAAIFLPLPLAICAWLFIALGMPGAVMSYAMDENFWHALNPGTWVSLMARLGWPYFVAVGLILVINASASNAQAWIAEVMPRIVGVPLFYCIAHYAIIATFHLMGYLIYQYHFELGFEPNAEPSLALPTDPDTGVLNDAAELVRDGETATATEMLRGHIRERGGSDAVHTQYRKLLRLANDKDALLLHGREYLPVLLGLDKDKQAVELVRDCIELDPTFGPTQAEWVTRLAAKAAQLGYTPVALRLLQGFAKRFPKSTDIPANYLLAAKLLSERMGKDAEARALLVQIKNVFPQHELIAQVDEMLAMLDKLGAAPAPRPA
jgi:hypothetical protein